MKKLIVFGATGLVGNHILVQSLLTENKVTAFCRNKADLESLRNPNLTIVQGDVFNLSQVEAAVKGQDVVIVTLGSGKDRASVVRSEGTANIISAMQRHGVERLICQTTLGNGDSINNLNFFWKHIMFGWYLKKLFLDHELQEDHVKDSGLQWTIIRPSAFTDGEQRGAYQHGFDASEKSLKLKISRADVAEFVLKQVDSEQYLFKTPGVSY